MGLPVCKKILHNPTRQRPGTQAGLALGQSVLVPTKQVHLKILEKAIIFHVPFVQLFKSVRIPSFSYVSIHGVSSEMLIFVRNETSREASASYARTKSGAIPGCNQGAGVQERLKLDQVPMNSRKSQNFS